MSTVAVSSIPLKASLRFPASVDQCPVFRVRMLMRLIRIGVGFPAISGVEHES
jgi:hypothetical protein